MSDVHHSPEADQVTDPITPNKPPLCWDDPSEARRWLGQLREQVLDALAAGEDGSRRPKERMFSRHEVGRRLQQAEDAILCLIDAAERGLPVEEVTR